MKEMKAIYTSPLCEIIRINEESLMQTTSRFSETGSAESPNKDKEHYNDPTGGIGGMDGGESLSKRFNTWSDFDN